MKTFLSILGIIAALVLCSISAAMNFLFLSSLGKTSVEAGVLGGASAAADLLKALLPFFIAWSWRDRRIIASGAGLFVWMFLSAFSLMSGIGFTADSKSVVAAEGGKKIARTESLQADIDHAHERMRALPVQRPEDSIRSAIKGHTQSRRWQTTKGCADATETASRAYCEGYFALQAELASAMAGAELTAKVDRLRRELNLRAMDTHDIGSSQSQVATLNKVSGLEGSRIDLVLTLAIALLVELGSSLGLFLASGHGGYAHRYPRNVSKTDRQLHVPEHEQSVGSLEEFCLEALVPDVGSKIPISDVVMAYNKWCTAMGKRSHPEETTSSAIQRIFNGVGLKIENNVVHDIELKKH